MTIDEASVVRSRSATLPSAKDGATQALLLAIRSVGLPPPVRELHFMWCCECVKPVHGWSRGYPSGQAAKVHRCHGCPPERASHAYRHERDWRFDLCWPAERLAVEIDGGVYAGGRHTRGAGFEGDLEKLNAATLAGWRVLRCTPGHIEAGAALEWVERALGRGRYAARGEG